MFIDDAAFLNKPRYAAAHILQQAGYATDPKYPGKLIQLIEKENFDRWDSTVSCVYENFTFYVPGKLVNDRNLVELRPLLEKMNFTLSWNGKDVIITK